MTPKTYKAPAVILEELGVTEPEEIDLRAIAHRCGATILYEPLDGCEARILGAGERAVITVNSRSRPARQRFSVGHELGHWMHDRGKVAFACVDKTIEKAWGDGDNPERRANRYAADLLLPRKLFQPRGRPMDPTFASVRELADTFTTSLIATAIRFVELCSRPAMLVANEPSRRWFYRSELIPESLWPRQRPGASTNASKLLDGRPVSASGPTEVDADEWIDHRDAAGYTLIEDSVRGYGDTVLSLLWWKDEAQITALARDDDERVDELSGELRFRRRR